MYIKDEELPDFEYKGRNITYDTTTGNIESSHKSTPLDCMTGLSSKIKAFTHFFHERQNREQLCGVSETGDKILEDKTGNNVRLYTKEFMIVDGYEAPMLQKIIKYNEDTSLYSGWITSPLDCKIRCDTREDCNAFSAHYEKENNGITKYMCNLVNVQDPNDKEILEDKERAATYIKMVEEIVTTTTTTTIFSFREIEGFEMLALNKVALNKNYGKVEEQTGVQDYFDCADICVRSETCTYFSVHQFFGSGDFTCRFLYDPDPKMEHFKLMIRLWLEKCTENKTLGRPVRCSRQQPPLRGSSQPHLHTTRSISETKTFLSLKGGENYSKLQHTAVQCRHAERHAFYCEKNSNGAQRQRNGPDKVQPPDCQPDICRRTEMILVSREPLQPRISTTARMRT